MSLKTEVREKLKNDIKKDVFLNGIINIDSLSKKYKVTKKTIYSYINQLEENDSIRPINEKSKKIYIPNFQWHSKKFTNKDIQEDNVWFAFIKPNIVDANENCQRIMAYCFTEMLNNAIDHSESSEIAVSMGVNDTGYYIKIEDYGVGIFEKIKKAFNLDNKKLAVFELSKGKTTTDPSRHTGEGIFFSSRSCDRFSICSDDLFFVTNLFEKDFLKEDLLHSIKPENGTVVFMKFLKDTNKNLSKIMDKFTDSEDYGFNKTVIPLKPLEMGYGEELISRSQAKRLLAGLDKFTDIRLDFKGIKNIEQAFADEVFRVFELHNPQAKISYINANKKIENMIQRIRNNKI